MSSEFLLDVARDTAVADCAAGELAQHFVARDLRRNLPAVFIPPLEKQGIDIGKCKPQGRDCSCGLHLKVVRHSLLRAGLDNRTIAEAAGESILGGGGLAA